MLCHAPACRALCIATADEAADVQSIQKAKQAAHERLNTLCGLSNATDGSAPANLGSLLLLADAVDLRPSGGPSDFTSQPTAAASAILAGAPVAAGQPTTGRGWSSTVTSGQTDLAAPMDWETRGAFGARVDVPPCHPLSWRCTEAAGEDRPPWLPQWHRRDAGVAGQPVQALHIH